MVPRHSLRWTLCRNHSFSAHPRLARAPATRRLRFNGVSIGLMPELSIGLMPELGGYTVRPLSNRQGAGVGSSPGAVYPFGEKLGAGEKQDGVPG